MEHYILAIDQGTTSTRTLLLNNRGQTKCGPQLKLPQAYPQKGWVEQDPQLIWQHSLQLIAETIAQYKLQTSQIKGVAITNQRETTVIWDRATGKPIYPAIVWQDRRTADICKLSKYQTKTDWVHQKTGLLVDPYFSATKIGWILDHVSGAREKAKRGQLAFGTIDSYLLWQFTGGQRHVTDVTNASRTLLLDLEMLHWDKALLDLFDIPEKILPDIQPCTGDFGYTDASLVGDTWPILAVAGDQQAALFGQNCVAPGQTKATFGTGCFFMQNTGTTPIFSKHRLLTTVAFQVEQTPMYALEGSTFMSGAIVEWLKEQLQLIHSSQETAHIAASVKDNNGVYLIPAFAGLGAPLWRSDIRASIQGLTQDSQRAHVVRAGLEAIAYQLKDLIDAVVQDTELSLSALKVDGGMIDNHWLMQFVADILNIEVQCAKIQETTAFGVALMAGLRLNWWTLEDLAALWQHQQILTPKIKPDTRALWIQGWRRAIQQATA